MYISPLTLPAILGLLSASSAYEITAYNNVDDCNADSNTVYRIFSDIQPNLCYGFEPNANGQYAVPCRQYNNAGFENGECNADAIFPASVLLNSGADDGWCTVWTAAGCQGLYDDDRSSRELKCVEPGRQEEYRSFSCGPTG